jgi:hypothetical protein
VRGRLQSIDRALSRLTHDVRDKAEMRVIIGRMLPADLIYLLGHCARPVAWIRFYCTHSPHFPRVLSIDIGDNSIGEFNKVGQSIYHGVARRKHSTYVFSILHLKPFFWFCYGRYGRLNMLNNLSQLSSIYRRTASSLTIVSPLLDRGRGHSIVQVYAGQEAAY